METIEIMGDVNRQKGHPSGWPYGIEEGLFEKLTRIPYNKEGFTVALHILPSLSPTNSVSHGEALNFGGQPSSVQD